VPKNVLDIIFNRNLNFDLLYDLNVLDQDLILKFATHYMTLFL